MTVSAIVGLLSIGLLFLVGWRVFDDARLGGLAAALLAMTPLHYAYSRLATNTLHPLPFVIAWLGCVVCFWKTGTARWLLAAGGSLGLGLYSHPAALVMMPVYVALTLVMLSGRRPVEARWFGGFLAGFLIAAAPLLGFLALHPGYLGGLAGRFHVYDGSRFTVLQGPREVVSWVGLTTRSEVYYDYFNPSFLFFQEDSFVATVTKARVLLLPLALLLPAGLYRVLRHERTPIAMLIVGGFLTAPIAAALPAEPGMAQRVLFMVPFVALLATYGATQLLTSRSRLARVTGVATLAAVPVCFALFIVHR